MKYNIKLLLAYSILLLSTLPAVASFNDAQHSWYRDSISKLQEQGVINGFDDGSFRPRDGITRAEMLKIAMRIGNKQILENTGHKCFPDVSPEAWYVQYICSAKKQDIAKGHKDGLFRPNAPVTYHEAIAFMARGMNINITESKTDEHWYDAYEKYAQDNMIVGANTYNVTTHIKRGQVAELANYFQIHQQNKKISYNSNGCGKVSPKNLSPLNVSGKSRTFLQYVPSNYDSNKTYGLIVAAHGRTNNNAMVQDYMGLEGRRQWENNRWQQGKQDDFIVVYPAGLSTGSGSFSWSQAENIEFFDHLISTVADNYCLDRRQIFMVGHSLGGYFTNKVSCLRGDVIRGMGVVGSTPYNGECSGPVASMVFHHPSDQLVAYSSGQQARDIRVNSSFCSQGTVPRSLQDYECKQYQQCRTGNEVVWCDVYNDVLGGNPHSWPRNAGKSFVEFFQKIKGT